MKILVTGGNGFIGQHLLKLLVKKPEVTEVVSVSRSQPKKPVNGVRYIDGDLSDSTFAGILFNNMQEPVIPDVVLHFAANPSPRLDENNPIQILDDNVKATQNLLQFCPEGCYFVLASSVVVYGNGINLKETDRLLPNNVYAATKIASESLLLAYYHHRGIKGASLRIPAVVGTGLTHGMLRDFIRKAKADTTTFEVFGNSPGPVKPYIHIHDLVKAINICIDYEITGTYNVCPDDNISVAEVAELTLSILSPEKEIVWIGQQYRGDTFTTHCSNEYFSYVSKWNMEFPSSRDAIADVLENWWVTNDR